LTVWMFRLVYVLMTVGLCGYSDVRGKPTIEYPDGPNVYLAEDIKKYVKVPVITVGKLGNPEFAKQVIEQAAQT